MSASWRSQPERGSRSALRLIIWLALRGGRRLGRMLLAPICFYFLLTAPLARRSSKTFLDRAMQRSATWVDIYLHLYTFATTLLDRVYLIVGRTDELDVRVLNEPVFWDSLKPGRGCLLMGSHLGSFELLGIMGSVEKKLAINVVMHTGQGAQLRNLVFQSGRLLPYTVIPLGQPGSMLQVKECLERGEVVGILADRVFSDEPTMTLPFLGSPAQFSLSPWRLAKITGAPVVAVFGLYEGGQRYRIVFERLKGATAKGEAASVLPTDQNEPVTHNAPVANLAPKLDVALVEAYVKLLERQARQFPRNWFNFYDYWST